MPFNFSDVFSRAVRLVRENKVLWLLGFLVALGGAVGGGSGNMRTITGAPAPMNSAWWNANSASIAAFVGCFALLAFVLGIALFVISTIARGSLVAAVQHLETEHTATFQRAWQVGQVNFWRMFGLQIVLALPVLIWIVLFIIFAVGTLGASAIFSVATTPNRANPNWMGMAAGGAAIAMAAVPALCALAIYAVVASGLRTLGERAIIIDGLTLGGSIRKGWGVLKGNLGNIILVALLLIVIKVALAIVIGLVVGTVFVLPIGVLVAQGGMTWSALDWAVVAIGLLVTIVLTALIGSVVTAFESAVWTLSYREFTHPAPPQSTTVPEAPYQPPLARPA